LFTRAIATSIIAIFIVVINVAVALGRPKRRKKESSCQQKVPAWELHTEASQSIFIKRLTMLAQASVFPGLPMTLVYHQLLLILKKVKLYLKQKNKLTQTICHT
jgi:hypothetical protein